VSGNVVISEVDVRMYVVLRKAEKHAPYGDLAGTTAWITVAHLVGALRYKPEDRGFYSGWCHWNYSQTLAFRQDSASWVDSDSHRN